MILGHLKHVFREMKVRPKYASIQHTLYGPPKKFYLEAITMYLFNILRTNSKQWFNCSIY